MAGAAPLWVCFLAQFISVFGDTIGQRACRVCHHGSRRRFMIGLGVMTSLQIFIGLTIVQLSMPRTATIIYEKHNGTVYDYCDAHPNSTHCYSQGPLTIYKAVGDCPILLINGLLDIGYYAGEAALYSEPLGVVLLVLAALTSSFIIAPLKVMMGLAAGKKLPVAVVVLGITGALISLYERTPKRFFKLQHRKSDEEVNGPGDGAESDTGSIEEEVVVQSPLDPNPPANANVPMSDLNASQKCSRVLHQIRVQVWKHLPLLAPFTLLAATYALYFVTMVYYNDHCKLNMWGYNSLDQVPLPLYLFAFFAVVDIVPMLRKTLTTEEDQQESFREAIRGTVREFRANRCQGMLTMFAYRFLINGRALIYSYIAIVYDLNEAYLQLTLIRVAFSWVGSAIIVLVAPRFILADPFERAKILDPVNLCVKFVGTVAIIGSLILLSHLS